MLNYLQNSTTASDIHIPTAHEGSQPSSQSLPTEDARVNEPDNESMISTDSSQPSPSSPEHSTTSQHSSESVESEMDVDAFLGPEYHPCTPRLLTYRIVGDNIDKNIKPRNMTSDHQTRSLHYFHAYAVRDRIDLSSPRRDQEGSETTRQVQGTPRRVFHAQGRWPLSPRLSPRRRRRDTPSRTLLNQMIPGNSPGVAVSMLHYWLLHTYANALYIHLLLFRL